ncbi:MAG: hypothetical protein U9N87_05675 [Planctomycetota bacterium]|nr:hypothetical protein [Planctomycetota bacterium]
MALRDWRSVVTKDYPDPGPVTNEAIQANQDDPRLRGSIRMATGRVWDDEEYEERRNKVLNTPLP